MNKILYDDNELIIISGPIPAGLNLGMILGFERAMSAHSIYVKEQDVLHPRKYKGPELLSQFREKHNINMIRIGKKEKKGYPAPAHMFATAKDQFLFELKFGT